MQRIFDEWTSYARDVVPAAAGETQREECRRAFYAGALSAFGAVLEAVKPEDENECQRNLKALDDEIRTAPTDLAIERPSNKKGA